MAYSQSIAPSFCLYLGGQLLICETLSQQLKLFSTSDIGDNVCNVSETMIWKAGNAVTPEER
jgi:hypothetical protein